MAYTSWKRSREADRWLHMPPSEARTVLIEAYDAETRQEALLRAFLAELDRDHSAARFWVAVYDLIQVVADLEQTRKGGLGGEPGAPVSR